ncbi:LnmK family bifunctional acyltransferase/decarboxylase [Streptomyces mesophilus]|uniref:LnmK family bifunctional acyltransferase/decarboxylase n=1 Tax=Streptomyces mesophilus TaxID=1775132 RepID=UPI00331AAA1D
MPYATHARRIAPGTVRRAETVQPGMSGPNALFVGRVGDWTWETVSEVCDVDAFRARDAHGRPSYLAFTYYRVMASAGTHPGMLQFGDRLDVVSQVFGAGGQSVLTVHRIHPVSQGTRPLGDGPLDPEEIYERRRADCIYVENFNSWISRGSSGTNTELVRSCPPGFTFRHLPTLSARHSPRAALRAARRLRRVGDPAAEGRVPISPPLTHLQPVDLTRDVNGAGLLYFASYFSVADAAVLGLWRHLGRGDRQFLQRAVTDVRMCFVANTEPETVLRTHLQAWSPAGTCRDEVADIVIEDARDSRLLAVCSLRLAAPPRAF